MDHTKIGDISCPCADYYFQMCGYCTSVRSFNRFHVTENKGSEDGNGIVEQVEREREEKQRPRSAKSEGHGGRDAVREDVGKANSHALNECQCVLA